ARIRAKYSVGCGHCPPLPVARSKVGGAHPTRIAAIFTNSRETTCGSRAGFANFAAHARVPSRVPARRDVFLHRRHERPTTVLRGPGDRGPAAGGGVAGTRGMALRAPRGRRPARSRALHLGA